MMGLLRRFVNVLRPGRLRRELDEELEFHRQMRLRKARERGLTALQAEQEARQRMGNLSLAKEQMQDARVIGWLVSSLQDLRHGATLLRRDAAVSALIVLVLALGIGGNAAIFTLLKAAFLDPLPYRDAGRLVTVLEDNGWDPSTSEFVELRARCRTLDQIAFAEHRDMQISGTGEPTRVYIARVTASFFPLLGVSASLGRTFLDEENQPGRTPGIVLTDAFWRAQLGADPGIIGHALRLDGRPAQVVGVLPPSFRFDYPTLGINEPVDLYVAYPIDPNTPLKGSGSGYGIPVRVIARLRDATTLAQAQAELRSIGQALAREHPAEYAFHNGKVFTFETSLLRDAIVGSQHGLLWLLLGGVGVLLLTACANTAQLLLARSLRRGREVAIRSALGASRTRLVRQFLLEGLVLAACGGLAGLLASSWTARILVALLPARSPLLESAHTDAHAFWFTLALSVISALAFAIVPALKGSRWSLGSSLASRSIATEGNRWRHAMIAIETALSVFLLCGAGLVAQNLWALISTPLGFDPDHLLAMQLKLPSREPNIPDPAAGPAFHEYLRRIEAIPGVDSATIVTGPPLRPARGGPISLAGVTDPSGKPITVLAMTHRVSVDYFRTLRIPLLAGRPFDEGDAAGRPLVAIVNEEAARRFGIGAQVIGKQLRGEPIPITIVGVVGNVRVRGRDSAPMPEFYGPSLQISWPNAYLIVRSALPSAQLVKQVKTAVGSANPEQSVFGVLTMDELIATAIAQPRFNAWLVVAFSLLATAMAAAGMYSVISCLVSQRTGEIAIRMALGAGRSAIVRTVLGTTSIWAIAGLAAGLALGLATRTVVRALSSATVQASPWLYLAIAVFFLAILIVASYAPIRRAARIDPAAALRCE